MKPNPRNTFLGIVKSLSLETPYLYNRWYCIIFSNRLCKSILTTSRNLLWTSGHRLEVPTKLSNITHEMVNS